MTEAIAIPAARAAGVRTPELIAFDDACDLLPVPYLIVERLEGVDAESAGSVDDAVWREVGRDLALFHSHADATGFPRDLYNDIPDARMSLEARAKDGTVTGREAEWFGRWLDRLGEPSFADEAPTHGDVQMSNVFVRDGRYIALLDWGCASYAERAIDFGPMPMSARVPLLAGYREVASLPDDIACRIVRNALTMILWCLPRRPDPRVGWGERPLAWLVDLMRFFIEPPEAWKPAAPPGRPYT